MRKACLQFYYGNFKFRGNVWPGNHPPYFSKERFDDRIKKLNASFNGRKRRSFQFPLSGILRCECGAMLTGQHKRGKYTYYTHRCKTSGRFMYNREDRIIEAIDSALTRARYSASFTAAFKGCVKSVGEVRKKVGGADLEALHRRELALKAKEERIADLFTEGDINIDLFRGKLDGLKAELKQLAGLRESFHKEDHKILIAVCEAIDALRNLPDKAIAAPVAEKKIHLQELVTELRVSPEGIQPVWKKPFSFLMASEISGAIRRTIAGNQQENSARGRASKRKSRSGGASGRPSKKSGAGVTEGRILWAREDSNFRPHPYQRCALTN